MTGAIVMATASRSSRRVPPVGYENMAWKDAGDAVQYPEHPAIDDVIVLDRAIVVVVEVEPGKDPVRALDVIDLRADRPLRKQTVTTVGGAAVVGAEFHIMQMHTRRRRAAHQHRQIYR